MRYRVLFVLVAAVLLLGARPGAQARPDFAGSWVFDFEKSSRPAPDGRKIAAPLFGDEFTARQDAVALTLTIRSGPLVVTAVYKLDGTDSINMSPAADGEIRVTSQATWERDRLKIVSRSTSIVDGQPVAVESTRLMSIDANGDLVLDRSGTPVSLVPATRSVYSRKKTALDMRSLTVTLAGMRALSAN